MIQRIQTVWLVLALLSTLALYWVQDKMNPQWLDAAVSFGNGLCAALLFGSIILYKNRKKQLLINNMVIIINALLVGFLLYWLANLSGGIDFPEKGIEPVFPLLSAICTIIASGFIKRDERLVKSVDRLR